MCDASVALKWFQSRRESEVKEALRILDEHIEGRLRIHFHELAFYEIGNVLVRKAGFTAAQTAAQLADLASIGQPIEVLTPAVRADAAHLAVEHRLTYYDASYWAVARHLDAPLITADAKLLTTGAGISPTDFVTALG